MTCATYKAIERLRNARDEIEMALRSRGELVVVPRQVLDAILDDVAVAGHLIRKMAECHDDNE